MSGDRERGGCETEEGGAVIGGEGGESDASLSCLLATLAKPSSSGFIEMRQKQ